MDGLECSEVLLSNLEVSTRIDAEYYRKIFLDFDTTISLRENKPMGSVADFLLGPFGSAYDTDNYLDFSPYRYIRGQDVKPFILKGSDPKYIAESDYNRLSKYALNENDVMVSVVGTLGNACIVRKKDLPAIFSCKSTVIRTKTMRPEYLVAYLNCKYGRELLLRKERGAIQKGLNLDDLKSVAVPVFSDVFESVVAKVLSKADANLDHARESYYHAEQFLLSELGIVDFIPSMEAVSINSLSESFLSSGRLDAEYYQPKYNNIESTIRAYPGGYQTFGNAIQYIFTGEYAEEYHQKQNGLSFYIRSTNMNNGQIEIDNDYCLFSKNVKTGDIITARVGTIGKFAEVESYLEGAICSDNVICFRLPAKFNPSVYTLLFNSKIMFELVDRLARGSVQQRLNQETIVINDKVQLTVAEMIRQSFELRRQAEQQLEAAKKSIEFAIEQGEGKAIAWLDEVTR